jgi:hypothetical protein
MKDSLVQEKQVLYFMKKYGELMAPMTPVNSRSISCCLPYIFVVPLTLTLGLAKWFALVNGEFA